MNKYRLLNVITLGFGITIAAPVFAESADKAAMDAHAGNEPQVTETVTEAKKSAALPAAGEMSKEDKESMEWMNKTLEEHGKSTNNQ